MKQLGKIHVPIRLNRGGNTKEHWRATHRRTKSHKGQIRLMLDSVLGPKSPCLPLTIVMTRRGPQKLDPDNLVASFKDVQDSVADWIGVDDGDSGYTWLYRDRVTPNYGVDIEFYKEDSEYRPDYDSDKIGWCSDLCRYYCANTFKCKFVNLWVDPGNVICIPWVKSVLLRAGRIGCAGW